MTSVLRHTNKLKWTKVGSKWMVPSPINCTAYSMMPVQLKLLTVISLGLCNLPLFCLCYRYLGKQLDKFCGLLSPRFYVGFFSHLTSHRSRGIQTLSWKKIPRKSFLLICCCNLNSPRYNWLKKNLLASSDMAKNEVKLRKHKHWGEVLVKWKRTVAIFRLRHIRINQWIGIYTIVILGNFSNWDTE